MTSETVTLLTSQTLLMQRVVEGQSQGVCILALLLGVVFGAVTWRLFVLAKNQRKW